MPPSSGITTRGTWLGAMNDPLVPDSFTDRLCVAILSKRNFACVGLDPDIAAYPLNAFTSLGLAPPRNPALAAAAIREINRRTIQEIQHLVPAVKFQSAFYEALGPDGIVTLRDGLLDARSAGLLAIVDAKRNDIGHSAQAYANAYVGSLSFLDGSVYRPFPADAVTVNPFLGIDGLLPFVETCASHDTGMFMLLRTSNPSGGQVQNFQGSFGTVADQLAGWVNDWNNEAASSRFGFGPVGVVIGATADAAALRRRIPTAFALVPGYGAQGGSAEAVRELCDSRGLGVVVNSSRGVLYGNEPIGESYWDQVRARTEAMCKDFAL